MKRWYMLAALAVVLIQAATASAQTFRYGWTISQSSTDPFMNQGAPTGAVDNLYLWYQCNVGDGLSAADLAVTGSFVLSGNVLGFNTMNNFLNAGSATSLLLAVGGCPGSAIVAGSWLVLHTGAGRMCFTAGGQPTPVSVDCSVDPSAHPVDYIGYSDISEGPPCTNFLGGSELCEPISVEETSWGTIKSLYR